MIFLSFLFYSINVIYALISIIVFLNKKIILINKFSKHNRINILSFENKYLHLYLSLDFQVLFLSIVNDLFIYLFTHIVLNLFNYMNAYFFLFELRFFKLKKYFEKTYIYIFYRK